MERISERKARVPTMVSVVAFEGSLPVYMTLGLLQVPFSCRHVLLGLPVEADNSLGSGRLAVTK